MSTFATYKIDGGNSPARSLLYSSWDASLSCSISFHFTYRAFASCFSSSPDNNIINTLAFNSLTTTTRQNGMMGWDR